MLPQGGMMAQGVSNTAAQLKERKTASCTQDQTVSSYPKAQFGWGEPGGSTEVPGVHSGAASTPYLESAWSLHSAAPAVTSSC